MKDYHARFRERFPDVALIQPDNEIVNVERDILAFFDEVVRKTELEAGYHTGREHERAALIEKVEGMRKNGIEILRWESSRDERNKGVGYNQALDDLLTHLRGEGLCIFHKDKNCCAYDEKQRSGIQEKPFKDLGEFVNAPEEKKRKVMLEVAREATNDQRAQIGLPPLQKEGASFSGRECGCPSTEDHWFPGLGQCVCKCHRPKENPTPQSREQGGDEKCCKKCDFATWNRYATGCKRSNCTCHQTNQ